MDMDVLEFQIYHAIIRFFNKVKKFIFTKQGEYYFKPRNRILLVLFILFLIILFFKEEKPKEKIPNYKVMIATFSNKEKAIKFLNEKKDFKFSLEQGKKVWFVVKKGFEGYSKAKEFQRQNRYFLPSDIYIKKDN